MATQSDIGIARPSGGSGSKRIRAAPMALSGARQQRRSESLVLRLGTKVRPWRSKTPRITPVLAAGVTCFRRSVRGEARAPLCGMGICFECRVTIDGVAHCRSCQSVCRAGMEVLTEDGGWPGVGTSADAARRSACATSQPERR